MKVKNKESVCERDSVIFNEPHYSWPLLSALMWIAAQSNGNLNIIDFGGSLGSTYFQNHLFLRELKSVDWNIIEQKHFVDEGKRYFENSELRFFYNIENCLEAKKPNTILFSSVIQYIEEPYKFLDYIISMNFKYILFDRTTFILSGDDRLTVQIVPPTIYRASYPCWFFNKNKFYSPISEGHDLIADFDALAGTVRIDNKFIGYEKGMIFRRRQ